MRSIEHGTEATMGLELLAFDICGHHSRREAWSSSICTIVMPGGPNEGVGRGMNGAWIGTNRPDITLDLEGVKRDGGGGRSMTQCAVDVTHADTPWRPRRGVLAPWWAPEGDETEV